MKNKSDINLDIDYQSAVPVYEQIKRKIILMISTGELKPDQKLFPIRELSKTIKVNHNTILKVYYQLVVEGYIYARPGIGYFVRPDDGRSDGHQEEIFDQLTSEYIHTAIRMGFTIEDVLLKIDQLKGNEDRVKKT